MTDELEADVDHEHPDVNGGWLRPAVFGAMDGLVSNFALIMGVLAASTGTDEGIVAGLAGLAAGAFSMAVGEYTSVASQAEFAEEQVELEREEIEDNPEAETRELAEMFERIGVDAATAADVAAKVHEDPEAALRVHSLAELGVRPGEYPSPMTAALASLVSFAVGALIPLVPLLFGLASLWPTILASLCALFLFGAIVTQVTTRSWWSGGLRQLVLGGAAAALTYAVGELVGSQIG